MTATAAQIAQLRRMIAEPTTTTYTDDALRSMIEARPCMDAMRNYPYIASGSANADWTATYDLSAAAADVWGEKAATLASGFDFSDGGQSFHRSQGYAQAAAMARYYASKRRPDTITLTVEPKPPSYLSDVYLEYGVGTTRMNLTDPGVVNGPDEF